MDGTAISLGKGRRMQIAYVELRKKTAVSGKYQDAKCQAGTVYHESVRWPGVQYPIIVPETSYLQWFQDF